MSIRVKTQKVLDNVNADVSEDTVAGSDYIVFVDTSDSNQAKRDTVTDLLSLVTGGTGVAFTFGISFPSEPSSGDIFMFNAAVASGLTWKDTDGSSDLTAADKYDIARYDGTDWIKQIDFDDFISQLNDLTDAAPALTDVVPFVDVSDSNANRKSSLSNIFALQTAVSGVWLTSDDFANDSLAATGTLNWTAETGAPTGAVDGNNTQCKLPKSNSKPNKRIVGLWFTLKDGDASDAIVADQFIPWLHTSPDLSYRLYANNNSYVDFTLELGDTDSITPIVTVTTTQDAGNTLTGMFLTISSTVIG